MASRIPFESLSAAERNRLLAENERLRQQLRDRYRLSDLAGNSPVIRRVRELVAQVAPSARSVCVHGEDGVGKTRAARAIHSGSTRAAGPFITLTCASMPDSDVDAQLFGCDTSGANPNGPIGGCVGRAHGGTLFVDDIADLGPLAQKRVLELARDRVWARLDEIRVPVNVRVVTATTRDLAELALVGRFRPDLSEHLAALTIHLPPLRERKSDLPGLAELFVEQFAREHVRGVSRVSARAMDMMMNYDWPGNVGQLRHAIERAVVLTSGPVIHHHHLPTEIQALGNAAAAPMVGLHEAIEEYEQELLKDALRQARGVRSQAARLLMTSERVFSYRLRKHGIDPRRFKAS